MRPGTVSIVITCYNYARYLSECVESVQAQHYKNWELIIVDDGSTDNSEEVARELVARAPHQMRYLKISNSGVSAARNIGIENTSGEYILPLDADDILYPWALEELVREIERDPNYGFAYGCLDMMGALPGEPEQWHPGPFSRKLFMFENLASVSNLWRRKYFDQGVRFRDGFFFEDWDLWLQLIEKGCVGGYVPVPTFRYRIHLDGRTSYAKYFYFQAYAQQTRANNQLYSGDSVRSFEETLLYNAPESFQKPTIAFLVPYGENESDEFVESILPLCQAFVDAGNLVTLFGDYSKKHLLPKGIYFLDLQGSWDFERIDPFFGKLGENLVLFTSKWHREVLARIKVWPTVSYVIGINEYSSEITDCTLRFDQHGFTLERPGVDLLSLPEFHSSVGSFVSAVNDRADERHRDNKNREAQRRKTLIRLASQQSFSEAKWDPSEDATIVIPCRNIELERLRRCLQSIRTSQFSSEIPIVVSDYGSHPSNRIEIQELCDSFQAQVVVTETAGPWSRARALNIGAQASRSKWLIFTDADMIFSTQLLSMWDTYRRALGDESMYLAQCKKLPPIVDFPRDWRPEYYALFEQRGRLFETYGHGGFQVLTRAAFEKIGGFNEQYTVWGSEDNDLTHRVEALGIQVCWLHSGELLHQWHIKSVSQSDLQRNRDLFKSLRNEFTFRPNDGACIASNSHGTQRDNLGQHSSLSIANEVEREILRVDLTDSERVYILLRWADHCLVGEQIESARESLEDVLTLEPDNLEALTNLAYAHSREQSHQHAAHLAYLVLRRNPSSQRAQEILRQLQTPMEGYFDFIDNDLSVMHQRQVRFG